MEESNHHPTLLVCYEKQPQTPSNPGLLEAHKDLDPRYHSSMHTQCQKLDLYQLVECFGFVEEYHTL